MQRMFISDQSGHFDFDVVVYKVLSPICTLAWRVNNYVSHQGKCINRRNESTDLVPLELLLTPCSTDDNKQ